MKRILLIAFKFPPYSRIGSHRWVNFSKHIAKSGNIIHVITLDWKQIDRDNWIDKVKHKNIIIHRIKSLYPHNFIYKKYSSRSIIGWTINKLKNQISKTLKIFFYIDDAQFWGRYLIPYCKDLIEKERIKNVIATGAPYMANYWATRLKEELGDKIKLIHDLRDCWYKSNYFNFNFQRKRSEEIRDYTLNNCDAIVTTTNGLKDYYSQFITNKKVKIEVVYNGFNKKNVNNVLKQKINKRDFSFIYAGSLDNERDKVFDIFLNSISNSIGACSFINDIKIFVFSRSGKNIIKKHKNLIKQNILIVSDLIPQEKLFEKIYQSFVALHLTPISHNFILSVKLFEYAALKRPVFSLNGGGDTERFIKNNLIGTSINYISEKNRIIKELKNYHDLWLKDPLYNIDSKSVYQYSYEALTKKYLYFIKNKI